MDKLIIFQYLKKILCSKLFKASSWLTAGGILTGILGYVFQIIMGRMLTIEEYGVFAAIIALVAVVSAPLGALTMVISRKVSHYRTNSDFGSIAHLFYLVSFRTLLVIISFLFIAMIYIEQVQTYLNISDIRYVYFLGGLLLVSFIFPINYGFLQGLQDFKWLSIGGILNTVIKIIFATTLVWAGFGVSGAFSSIIFASIVIWFVTYIVLKETLIKGRGKPFQIRHITVKSTLPVLIANLSFIMMVQMDMVLVKYYFSDQDVGIYAAASILGKAVMYLPGGIALALFPMVAENHSKGDGSKDILLQALLVTFLLCSFGALVYYFLGEEIIVLFYGEDYRAAGEVLKFFGIAILPMALIMVLENFLIAQGRVLFAYLFMVIAPLQVIAIQMYHDSLLMIVSIVGISGYVLVMIGFGLILKNYKNYKIV